jgi:hypothetical protein
MHSDAIIAAAFSTEGEIMSRVAGGMLSALCALAYGTGAARAAEPCIEFAWDARAEHALFAMQPVQLPAGAERRAAPLLNVDRLYQLQLRPQADVAYPTPPGGHSPPDKAFGGLAKFQVAVAGAYRISADGPVWIDVAFNGALLKPQDFEGRRGCNNPHKIVEFVLPMGVELTLQFSAAVDQNVKIAVTPSPEPAH